MAEVDALTNCPKCGFEQPVDTYCAKCGVDMTSLPKKSPSLATKPAFLAGGAALLIIVTFVGIRTLRSSPAPSATEQTANALASESPDARRERLSAQAPSQLRQNIEQRTAEPETIEASPQGFVENEPVESSTSVQAAALSAASAPTASPAPSPSAGATAATAAADGKAAGDAARKNIEIDFMWGEASREALQALGATGPGLHPVPDLKAKLRAMPNAVVVAGPASSARQNLDAGEALNFDFNRGDRIATHFEIGAFTGTSFSGTVQISVRAPDGAIRTPAPLPLALDKDQGGLLVIGGPGPGPNPTGAEIVVLILPRWGADRNP